MRKIMTMVSLILMMLIVTPSINAQSPDINELCIEEQTVDQDIIRQQQYHKMIHEPNAEIILMNSSLIQYTTTRDVAKWMKISGILVTIAGYGVVTSFDAKTAGTGLMVVGSGISFASFFVDWGAVSRLKKDTEFYRECQLKQ